ncbi:hypothetical protein [Streptomyces canus]|uniref:hypothetical protein n=1 Tax=Streptomyces canus TaxID=58343 RepID=UPI0033B84002
MTLVGAQGAGERIMAKALDIASVGLAAEQAGGGAPVPGDERGLCPCPSSVRSLVFVAS